MRLNGEMNVNKTLNVIWNYESYADYSRAQLYVYNITSYMFCMHNCIHINVKRKAFDKDIIMDLYRTYNLKVMLSRS